MPVLRSGKISSPSPSPQTVDREKTRSSTPPVLVEPITPVKTGEPLSPGPTRRRSLRLSTSDFTPTTKRSRNEKTVLPLCKSPNFSTTLDNHDFVSVSVNDSVDDSVSVRVCDDSVKDLGLNDGINQEFEEIRVLSSRSGAKVVQRKSIGGDDDKKCGNVEELGQNGVINQELGGNEGINGVIRGNEVVSLRAGTREMKRVSVGGDDDDIGNVFKEFGEDEGVNEEIGVLSLRSGTRLVKRVSVGGDDGDIGNVGTELGQDEGSNEENEALSLRTGAKVEEGVVGGGVDDEPKLRSRRSCSVEEKGKRRLSGSHHGVGDRVEEDDGLCSDKIDEGLRYMIRYMREEMGKSDSVVDDQGGGENNLSPRRYTKVEKGKGVALDDDIPGERNAWKEIHVRSPRRFLWGQIGENKVLVDERGVAHKVDQDFSRRFSREEKGKGVASVDDAVIDGNDDYGLAMVDLSVDINFDVEMDQEANLRGEMNEGGNSFKDEIRSPNQKNLREVHKNIARRNAFKYAHFSVDDNEAQGRQQEDGEDMEGEDELPERDSGLNVEDWPGPFSTAMKIIRDRVKNMGGQTKNSCLSKGGMPLISWKPKIERCPVGTNRTVPSLQNMCLKVLSENVDAIGSLNYVPDVLRHKLCQMLCDSRKMNAHFFSLLLEGSPSEIRVADCSWLEEEEFESSIKACDTSRLTVLQLDLCGQCLSDSSLLKAVAPKQLLVLTTISLKGACRISDNGLKALVSAAPVLRSMNLSQCSLLTDAGIKTIADSLGSIVHELYLDDCDTLDAMSILPSLQRLFQLEVLSLRGISSVSNKFIKKLIKSNGHILKELILANCVNVSDSSLKIISETCSQLCVLDLSYLKKLTDVGMAYLANGCRGIQDLRLCRNAFSDDAIAAFLEASGESLKELSLNNITKVGQNTALSLARRCKNLVSLDLSWCRSLPDEALGLIADSCVSLRLLKIFGCTQITKTFVDGHSNPDLHIIGMKLTPILEHIKRPDFQQGPLYYSAVPSL